MRALLAITARELRERWTLPLATFCFGFVPLVLVLRAGERALPIAALAAVPTAWTVAVMMGSSVIARDLGDGRLGFFFARPVPWWAIAGGKLLAAVLLTLATALAGALPAVLAPDWNLSICVGVLRDSAASGSLALFLVLLLGLVAFGHAAGVVYRSRSAWAALDVLLFAAAVALAVTLFRAFVRLGAVTTPPADTWRFAVELLLVALVPLAAAAAQSAFGRSDPRRGHRALSLTFWGGAFVWFAVIGGLLARELAATPAGFAMRHVARAADDGRFLSLFTVDGSAQPYRTASFLFDTGSGRSLRISNLAWPSFAPDGRHAAWVEEAPFWRSLVRHHDLDLSLARLDGPAPLVETMELDPPLPEGEVRDLALAARGERVAVVQAQTLSVHELPSGRSLSRTAAADGEWVAAAFLPDGRLRALRRVRAVVGGPGRAVLPGFLELVDLAGGVASGRLPLEAVGHAVLASGIGGERILLHEPLAPRTVSLHDARSGRRLRVFTGEPGWTLNDALLLTSDAVAVLESSGAESRLRLSADGEADRLIELPAAFAMLGGELPGGRITVGLYGAARPGTRDEKRAGDTVIISLATGEIVRREAALLPAVRQGLSGTGRQSPGVSTLFQSQAGEIARLDVDTGARQVVLAAKPSR
jgi:hypothetical protein